MSVVHWIIAAPTVLPWVFAASAIFGPFQGFGVILALSLPHLR